ncbi:MAG TPA: Holliday junction branch migration protein RuvA [Lachnospiraceae bacterium]|nr:Holliday junction branch migration protein RuvA [Lachnospiraceae bacterium]
MIGYIKGLLDSKGEDRVWVENSGIGFEIFVPGSVMDELPHTGEEIKLYTYLHVREDIMQLYGFLTADTCELFKLLLTVSGVGPKGALGILTVMDADTLRFALLAGDAKAIAKAPGVGKKTAEKVVLELRDKIDQSDYMDPGNDNISTGTVSEDTSAAKDTIEALVALGYSSTDAMRAVKSAAAMVGDADTETLLKAALKSI